MRAHDGLRFARPASDPLQSVPVTGAGRFMDWYLAQLRELLGADAAAKYLPRTAPATTTKPRTRRALRRAA